MRLREENPPLTPPFPKGESRNQAAFERPNQNRRPLARPPSHLITVQSACNLVVEHVV